MKIKIPIPFTNLEIKGHDPALSREPGAWQCSLGVLKVKQRTPLSPGVPPRNAAKPQTTQPVDEVQRLKDRYPVAEVLAHGGSGKTTLYRKAPEPDPNAGIGVVVKEPHGSKKMAALLQAEAEAHAQIQNHVGVHPHLVRHLFTSRSAAGRMQVATQYVDGVNLSKLSKRIDQKVASGKLSSADASEMRRLVARDILVALGAVSSAGYYHGDVHAANVLIGKDGVAKLVDFGFTRRHGEVPVEAGATHHPSEYGRREPGRERTDVYMMGVLLERIFGLKGDLGTAGSASTQTSPPNSLRETIERMTKPGIDDRCTLQQASTGTFFGPAFEDEDRIRAALGRLVQKSA